jgi:transcriptional regulator with XRE-family HTH domain
MYAGAVHAADLLRDTMTRAGLSASELARRSGLGRSTIYRYLDGSQEPGLTTLDNVLAVAGVQAHVSLAPLSDPDAATALLSWLLPDQEHPRTEGVERWVERFGRTGNPTDALRLGGSVGSVLRRPDAIGLAAAEWSIDRLVSAGNASRQPWALSGWAALDAMGHDVSATTIFWADDPRKVRQLLADTFTTTSLGDADLIVVRAEDETLQEATSVQDVRLVAPTRAYVDALGLGGEAETLALRALERRLRER